MRSEREGGIEGVWSPTVEVKHKSDRALLINHGTSVEKRHSASLEE